MKAFAIVTILFALSLPSYAQSRPSGAGGLGSMASSGGKPTTASAKDLERAQRLADQARGRLGGTKKSSGGWATGGGWATRSAGKSR